MSEFLHARYWVDVAIIFLAIITAGLGMFGLLTLWHGLHKHVVREHVPRPFESKGDIPAGQPDS